jgi:hypothetical protein
MLHLFLLSLFSTILFVYATTVPTRHPRFGSMCFSNLIAVFPVMSVLDLRTCFRCMYDKADAGLTSVEYIPILFYILYTPEYF